MPLDEAASKRLGLDKPIVTVTVQCGPATHELAFSRRAGGTESLLPAHLLARGRQARGYSPGSGVDRTPRSRRQIISSSGGSFPSERVARDSESGERTDRLLAKELDVKGVPANSYEIEKAGAAWQLREPVKDRLDPDKLAGILGAVPDIWAEQFVAKPKADLAEYGLKEPAQSIGWFGIAAIR